MTWPAISVRQLQLLSADDRSPATAICQASGLDAHNDAARPFQRQCRPSVLCGDCEAWPFRQAANRLPPKFRVRPSGRKETVGFECKNRQNRTTNGMQSARCASCTSRRAHPSAGSPDDHWEPSSPGPRPATYRLTADLALRLIGHLPAFLLTYDAAGIAWIGVRRTTHCRCAVDEGRPKDLQPVALNWA